MSKNLPGYDLAFTVLLTAFNGHEFLDLQLRSLAAQDVGRINVLASDDGSSDATRGILETSATAWRKGTFEILQGPQQGFSENFRSLILRASSDADYFAFCDQDDVWDPEKLSVAGVRLAAVGGETPAVYFSRTRLIDVAGNPIGYSPLFRRAPSFKNALVQSIGGGNTMVLNRAGFELLRATARRTSFVSHDWWCYLVVAGAGGQVVYDPVPHIGYRQHPGNLIGHNVGLREGMRRLNGLAEGRFSRWTDRNLAALDQCRDLLTVEARDTLDAFFAMRRTRSLTALDRLRRAGLYRQTRTGDFALRLAAMLGKI